jgi:hypothetical protein
MCWTGTGTQTGGKKTRTERIGSGFGGEGMSREKAAERKREEERVPSHWPAESPADTVAPSVFKAYRRER